MTNDLNSLLKIFKKNRFDPNADRETTIPDQSGNYIICLKSNSKLPTVSIIPTLTSFNGLKVIYTGIAGGSLRSRDYRQHFKSNNAGRSTLRKSLGVLFGYKLIPRDKDPNNGKTKFGQTDEKKLSDWMSKNLLMFFLPTTNFVDIEIALINRFNPPLNLKDNHNSINADFRKLLSNLRSGRTSVKPKATTTTTVKTMVKKKITPTKTTRKNPKTTDNSEIIKAIDDSLIETGKHYLLLGQANQLLLSQGLIENNKVLKQMLERNEIPYAQQTDGAIKQWRIPLSKAGEQRRNSIEKRIANTKKSQEAQKLKLQDNAIKCPFCGSEKLTVGKHSIDNGFDATGALVANYLTKSSLAGFLVGGLNSGYTESEFFVYCFNCQAEFSPDDLSPKRPIKNVPTLLPSTDYSIGTGCAKSFGLIIIILTILSMVGKYCTG